MMEEKLDEFSFKELMAYSIEAEKEAKKFYSDFAKAGLGALVKERYKSLANDEEIHKEELLKRYEEKFGTREYEVPKSDELPPHETSYDFSNARNIIDALDKGINNEENARVIYEYMGKRFDNYSSFFRYLALMEKGHYESLSEELALMEGEIEEGKKGDKKAVESFWKGMGSEQDSAFGDREHMR
ncbi:MAG: ferritin family protein [Candidatus Thermoplasmatota archaeon]|nr:ferritin family protein [Candidatus Thermoplasmatota archaeon]MBS3790083.1 ferritin family protein [Candidatus Thermoplasmatota archaeon]